MLLVVSREVKVLPFYLYLYQNLSSKYPNNKNNKDNEKNASMVFQFKYSAGIFGAIIENEAKSADPEI